MSIPLFPYPVHRLSVGVEGKKAGNCNDIGQSCSFPDCIVAVLRTVSADSPFIDCTVFTKDRGSRGTRPGYCNCAFNCSSLEWNLIEPRPIQIKQPPLVYSSVFIYCITGFRSSGNRTNIFRPITRTGVLLSFQSLTPSFPH